MNIRRQGAPYRTSTPVLPVALALLLVFTAFLTLSGAAWAQSAGYAFPYLGPDKQQSYLLQAAYIAQSQLFSSLAGTGAAGSTGFSTIQLFGILAALVGGIFFAFNKKLWQPSIFAAWLLIVVVVIFTPYSSQLLFTKIKSVVPVSKDLEKYQILAGSCSDNNKGCGFTPQLAGIHVASIMQVAVADMFMAQGWRNIIQELRAGQRLNNNPYFVAPHALLKESQELAEGSCKDQVSLNQAIGVNEQVSVPNADPAQLRTITFAERWNTIRQQFNSNTFNAPILPMIVLPNDNEASSWTENQKTAYAAGIQKIYDQFIIETAGQRKIVKVGGGSGYITVEQALGEITTLTGQGGFFTPIANNNTSAPELNPGFFIVRSENATSTGTNTAPGLRRCYTPEIDPNGAINEATNQCARTGYVGNASFNPAVHRNSFQQIDDYLKPGSNSGFRPNEMWVIFKKVFNEPVVQNMPVQIDYSKIVFDGQQPKITVQVKPGEDCKLRAAGVYQQLIQSVFTKINNNQRQLITPLVQMLTEKNANVPEDFSRSAVYANANDLETKLQNSDELQSIESFRINFNADLRDEINRRQLRQQPALTPEERKARLAEAAIGAIRINSANYYVSLEQGRGTEDLKGLQSTAERNATDGARELQVVGSTWLTQGAGWLASRVGEALTIVASWFYGPIAQAYLNFLTILIQLALLALIVITPFLFLAGILMPSAAAGVLVISVMAAFILQFVPITLIIMNYLGGMIYEMIGIANVSAWNSQVMKSMLIIGMGGLYTGIIGLTLYLMFKLGDPAAMLGRLSALDGAAKQIADVGMKATIAAATPLAAGLLGSLLPLLAGSKYAGPFAKLLGSNKGGPDAAGTGAAGDGSGGGGTGGGGAMTPVNAAESDGSLVPDALSPNSDIAGNFLGEFSGDEYDKMNRALKRAQSDTNFIKHTFEDKDDDFRHMVDLDDQGRFKAQFDKFGNLTGTFRQEPPGSGELRQFPAPETLGSVGADASAEGTDTTADQEATNQPTDTPDATRGTDDIKTGNLVAGAGSGAAGTEPAKPTIAQQVTPPTEKEKKETAEAIANAKDDASKNLAGATNFTTSNTQQLLAQATEQFKAQKAKEIIDIANNRSLSDDQKKAQIGLLQQAMKDADKNALEFNQVGRDLSTGLLNLSKIDETSKARLGADVKPGWGSVMASGFLGGFKAVGGGVGSIPIIGSVLKGSFNEYYEAPERAKAWQAAGGFWKHFNASGDAQRLKYYQQEIAPLNAGFQYQQMEQAGAFQAQVDLQLNTTAQAVARSRSEFEALLQRKLNESRSPTDLSLNKLSIADIEAGKAKILFDAADYQGIGQIDAAQKISTVRNETFAMQSNSMRIAIPDGKGNDFTDIKPNAAIFSRVYGDLGKDVAKYFDQAMVNWYGVVEKQMGRGKDEWNSTRNMSFDREAMASFMAQDISTDYLVSGHHKMVTGKDQFMRMRGTVLKMIQTRNEDAIAENEVITKFVVQQGGDKQRSMIEALKVTEKDFFDSRKASGKTEVEIFTDYKNSFFKKSPRADIATFERTILNKWAKSVGGFKAKMDLMAEEQVIRGGAEWEQRLDRAAKASYQEVVNKRKARAKDLSERASELGKSTDSITWGQTTKNPLKAYGAVSELSDPINTKLIKAFKKIGMSEEKALERAAEIAFGIIEDNIDILDSYQVSTVKIGKKEHNAIMFAKKDLEAAFQSAVAQAAKDGVDIAELTADLNKSFKDIDDTASTGRVALRESKAE